MKKGLGCLTVLICFVTIIYFKTCKKEIDYFIFPSKFREATYYEKFDPLTAGETVTIKIKQNYICEHSFAIIYFDRCENRRFTMGNVGKFHFTLRSSGKIIQEKTVVMQPDKAVPGAALLPDNIRHELFLFTFELSPEELKDAQLTVTVLEPMTNLHALKGKIFAGILPVWTI